MDEAGLPWLQGARQVRQALFQSPMPMVDLFQLHEEDRAEKEVTMICIPCRDDKHDDCPEIKRQQDKMITKTDKLGGDWCYCHHTQREKVEPAIIPPVAVQNGNANACAIKPRAGRPGTGRLHFHVAGIGQL